MKDTTRLYLSNSGYEPSGFSTRIRGRFDSVSASTTIGTSYTLYYQTSPNVSHGITGWLPNNAYSWQGPEDTNNGGFSFVAATDAATPGALNFYGIMGTTSPTSNAINFRAAKKNGTSIQALGAAENAMVFNNYGGTDLLQFKGNGDG